MDQSLVPQSVTRKLLLAMSLGIVFFASAAMTGTPAAAGAGPVAFFPDWPFYEMQTEQTMCDAMAQGWPRARIIDEAVHANDVNRTGMNPAQAAKLAGMWIDLAHIKYCPGA